MKKILIIKEYGRLTNQLWLYISVYAFCLEKGYVCDNLAFYEYRKYFPNVKTNNLIVKFFIEKLGILTGLRSKKSVRKVMYKIYYRYLKQRHKKRVIKSQKNITYLSPTKEAGEVARKIKEHDTLFFDGWLFRNPDGIEKYREEIRKKFKPEDEVSRGLDRKMSSLRKKYDKIIGVHIRQGDYRHWQNGKHYFSPTFFNKVLESFKKKLDSQDVCFLICSDEPLRESDFPNINSLFNSGNLIEDLFALSRTDLIIGSNSTFGAFASYYGDIPFKVVKGEFPKEINWEYYLNKGYFENKGSTVVKY